jgi:hypothetical protein
MRVGPDGIVIQEVITDYAQTLELTVAQAAGIEYSDLEIPPELPPTTRLQFWGGGTLIFDQFGRVKLHQRKDLDDWERQSRRLKHLFDRSLFDTLDRLGFSYGAPLGMAFADLHAPDTETSEVW